MVNLFVVGSFFPFFFYSLSWRWLLRLRGGTASNNRLVPVFVFIVVFVKVEFEVPVVPSFASFVHVINRPVAAQWLSLLTVCGFSSVFVLCGPVMRSLVLVVFVVAAAAAAAVDIVIVVAVADVVVMVEPIRRVDGSMAFWLSFGNLRVATSHNH